MKYFDLTPEELDILKSFEDGQFVSTKSLKNMYTESAKNHLQKTKNINIRLSEGDVFNIKAKALEEGIPYQTLAASILHKYATEKLKYSN